MASSREREQVSQDEAPLGVGPLPIRTRTPARAADDLVAHIGLLADAVAHQPEELDDAHALQAERARPRHEAGDRAGPPVSRDIPAMCPSVSRSTPPVS